MGDREEWPPRSPMKALLSSPSGRKKYREYQQAGALTSPNKLLGSPSLLEKLRAARESRDLEISDKGVEEVDQEDEDEETLQLKLQAIQAKLKLKKLQQQKARDHENGRPQSSTSGVTQSSVHLARTQVALSPNKRPIAPSLPKSPSRVLLGIDKGLNAADVSLRRARTISGSPTRKRVHHVESRLVRPTSSVQGSSAVSTPAAKSFSERMADMRDREQGRERKQNAAQNARLSHFKFDQKELKGYHIAADPKSKNHLEPTRTNNERPASEAPIQRGLQHSKSMPSMRAASPPKTARPTANPPSTSRAGDPSLFEGFSNTHLSSRILPHSFLKRTLPPDQFKVYTIAKLLRDVSADTAYQVPDSVTDYVIFGIIARKSSPLTHKARTSDKNTSGSGDWQKKWDDGTMNKQKFIINTLTDLKWTIDLYLFDNAVPRYHRLTPGTLIAILNPGIMPPKKGKEDTGAFSLAIHDGEDQILEIGTAQHLGYCKTTRKDGHPCGDWVNSSKTEICEYHVNMAVERTRSRRSGINSMSGWGKDHPPPDADKLNRKKGWDHEAQSFYYAVGGTRPKKMPAERWSFAPTRNPGLSTAKLLDINPGDDPFIADGQMLERDKSDRQRKRMAAMQKEHEIAKKLAMFGGSAGGQYMRSRTADENDKAMDSVGVQRHAPVNGVTIADIMADRPGESKKRAADSVKLGPVKKKTRFLTEAGIKEAGRESLGGAAGGGGPALESDDDLDIV